MTNPSVTVRAGRLEDAPAITELYRAVAQTPRGIARAPDEVSRDYVDAFMTASLARGLVLVAELEGRQGLAGELHAYRSELRVFRHVLGELTVAVHPRAQGQGIGKRLFQRLLAEVRASHPDITRVELVTQETNHRALRLYEGMGFTREGRFAGRVCNPDGTVEADIPLAWLR